LDSEKALLWDTGSRNALTREAVDRLIAAVGEVNTRARHSAHRYHSHHHAISRGDAAGYGPSRRATFRKTPDLGSLESCFRFQKLA